MGMWVNRNETERVNCERGDWKIDQAFTSVVRTTPRTSFPSYTKPGNRFSESLGWRNSTTYCCVMMPNVMLLSLETLSWEFRDGTGIT